MTAYDIIEMLIVALCGIGTGYGIAHFDMLSRRFPTKSLIVNLLDNHEHLIRELERKVEALEGQREEVEK